MTTDMITITTRPCFHCGQTAKVAVPAEGFGRWRSGELIQIAMPTLSPEIREQLISGTHPRCWNELFPPDDTPDEAEA